MLATVTMALFEPLLLNKCSTGIGLSYNYYNSKTLTVMGTLWNEISVCSLCEAATVVLKECLLSQESVPGDVIVQSVAQVPQLMLFKWARQLGQSG